MNNGLFGQDPQQIAMLPQAQQFANQPVQPTDPQTVAAMNAMVQQQQAYKYSVGNPILDKYINMFLGG